MVPARENLEGPIESVAFDGAGPLFGVERGRGVEPVALGIDLETEHRRGVRTPGGRARVWGSAPGPETSSESFSRNSAPTSSGSSGLARKSFVGIDSSSAEAPGVAVTSTADCVARTSAAFFFRHVFAASAR